MHETLYRGNPRYRHFSPVAARNVRWHGPRNSGTPCRLLRSTPDLLHQLTRGALRLGRSDPRCLQPTSIRTRKERQWTFWVPTSRISWPSPSQSPISSCFFVRTVRLYQAACCGAKSAGLMYRHSSCVNADSSLERDRYTNFSELAGCSRGS